jgi:hypothetical protein
MNKVKKKITGYIAGEKATKKNNVNIGKYNDAKLMD